MKKHSKIGKRPGAPTYRTSSQFKSSAWLKNQHARAHNPHVFRQKRPGG